MAVGKDANQTNAILDVLAERDRQDRQWGGSDNDENHNPEVWLAILSEEVGELAKAILHIRFGGPNAANVKKEAISVAAVAVAMLEQIYKHPSDF